MFQNVSYGFYINNTHYCTSALLRSTLFEYNEAGIYNNKE